MSVQVQPQQQPHVQVYPDTATNQPQSHHSNGSFGTVFIVLAIILVISVVACVLGRLCNRRNNNNNSRDNHNRNQRPVKPPLQHRQQMHNNNIHPRGGEEEDIERGGDIEFGVDNKRMPTPIISRPNNGHVLHGGAAGGGGGRGPLLHIPPPPAMRAYGRNHIGHEGELRGDA